MKTKNKKSEKKYYCCVSEKEIPRERVKFLMESGIAEHEWTVVEHSPIQKVKGLYTGESGTSTLLIVDKIYDDTVRSIFKRTETEDAEPVDEKSSEENN